MTQNFKFIKLNKNSKTPIKNQFFKDTHKIEDINTNYFNVGLMAGSSNLIILDIDEKDGGRLEWSTYLSENFSPYTRTQQTPNNGLHLIFKHHDETYTDEENEAIKRLKNKSKYRNKGLDIRKGAGYIVYSPSKIDGKEYKIIDDIEPQKMPLKLVLWLLEYEAKEKTAIHNNIILMNDEEELKELLKNFNDVSPRTWLAITTATKNLLNYNDDLNEEIIKKIWNKWSKKQEGYDKINNFKIWDSLTANISFNFIISQYNKTQPKENKIKFLESFKPLEEMKAPENIKHLILNNKYLYDAKHTGEQFDEKIFYDYSTIIIKSTTGTGKTSSTAQHVEKYFKSNNEYKFLSIVNLKTVASQHLENFKKINIISYEDEKLKKEDDSAVICINSLMMYSRYEPEFFKNYIVYIDEITSLIDGLTHNPTLDKNLKGIYIVLMKIIKNAHKIVVSDATINNNTFTLLNIRDNEKTIYIENNFKKYEGLSVFKYNDENKFLEEVQQHVNKNDYFLFGCDSLTIAEQYYNKTINTEEKKEKSSLYTSNEKIKVINANEQFKEKFIFYSPSITTGVDFSHDTPQDVFIYINGKTINPIASFQQLTRTRNIRNVYLYISEIESKPAKYNTVEETKEHLKNISKYENTDGRLKKICCSLDSNDEYIFNENSFFHLYSFNEYINDVYETNKKYHFYKILWANGFKVIENDQDITKLNKETKKEMTDKRDEIDEIKFNIEIKKLIKNEPDKETTNLKSAMNYLNIFNAPTAIKFKELIQDKFKREDYFNLIKLLRTEEHINKKLENMRNNTTTYKIIYNNFYKISLLFQLEKELKLKYRFDFNKLEVDAPCKISNELILKINTAYRCNQSPTTYNEFIEYYINKIKNITGGYDIITKTRKQINKKRETIYKINEIELNKALDLYELTDERRELLIKCQFFKPLKPLEVSEGTQDYNFLDNLEEILTM
jgi:hypothetical protein